MKINTAIRRVMKDKGFTYHMMATALSAAIGKTITENSVGSKLSGGDNMKINNAIRFLSFMGYEIVVQPKTSGARKAGSYVIDGRDENDE